MAAVPRATCIVLALVGLTDGSPVRRQVVVQADGSVEDNHASLVEINRHTSHTTGAARFENALLNFKSEHYRLEELASEHAESKPVASFSQVDLSGFINATTSFLQTVSVGDDDGDDEWDGGGQGGGHGGGLGGNPFGLGMGIRNRSIAVEDALKMVFYGIDTNHNGIVTNLECGIFVEGNLCWQCLKTIFPDVFKKRSDVCPLFTNANMTGYLATYEDLKTKQGKGGKGDEAATGKGGKGDELVRRAESVAEEDLAEDDNEDDGSKSAALTRSEAATDKDAADLQGHRDQLEAEREDSLDGALSAKGCV